jgi:hypothetical protein
MIDGAETPERNPSKKTYTRPELTEFGRVQDLTRGTKTKAPNDKNGGGKG